MSWSLGIAEAEDEELDEYLLSLGKATSLACSFEKKCLWVVRIGKAVQHSQTRNPQDEDVLAFLIHLDDSVLGNALRQLAKLPGVEASSMDLLNRGRVARNVIVHELGDITPVSSNPANLAKLRERLRRELDELIVGDACISEWAYWIGERQAPPFGMVETYPDRVRQWVLREAKADVR